MKAFYIYWSVIFTGIFCCSIRSFSQLLYDNVGHFPPANQVKWRNAGLLPRTPQAVTIVYDVTRESGANWEQKIDLTEIVKRAKNSEPRKSPGC